MTSTVVTPGSDPAAPADRPAHRRPLTARPSRRGGVSLPRAVLAEWTKFRSLRSTWAVLALVVVLSLGVGAAIAAAISDPSQPPPRGGPAAGGLTDPVAAVLAGTSLAALALGVLGALTASGEYATGSMAATLMAVPRRWPVLVAKAALLVGVVAPFALGMSVGALWLGSLVLGDAATIRWSDSSTIGALLGTTGYLTAVALLGLALAVLLRSSAGSITLLVAVVFVLPVLLPLISWDWVQTAADHLPGSAGQSLQATATATLSDAAATWTLLAWTLVPLAGSAVVLQRRDA